MPNEYVIHDKFHQRYLAHVVATVERAKQEGEARVRQVAQNAFNTTREMLLEVFGVELPDDSLVGAEPDGNGGWKIVVHDQPEGGGGGEG